MTKLEKRIATMYLTLMVLLGIFFAIALLGTLSA